MGSLDKAAQVNCLGYPVNPYVESCLPVINALGYCPFADGPVGPRHDLFQLSVNPVLFPAKLLQVLSPLKIRDGDSSGIYQNIRQDNNSLVIEGFICLKGDRMVGRFQHNPGFHLRRIAGSNHIVNSRWHQHIAFQSQKLGIADSVPAWKLRYCAASRLMFYQSRNIQTLSIINSAVNIAYR
jgi:hypothetical protein